jgi:bacillithiol system protein YtxJ
MSDAPFHPLRSDEDWAEALAQSEEQPVLIFKHSAACPVSASADAEMTELAREVSTPAYKVVVQEHRAVSDAIEDDLAVRHETPQAIVLDDRSPVFDTSHFNVTAETLRKELRRGHASVDE